MLAIICGSMRIQWEQTPTLDSLKKLVCSIILVGCIGLVWGDDSGPPASQPPPEPSPLSVSSNQQTTELQTIIPIMPSATMMPNPTVFPKQPNTNLPVIKPVNNGMLEQAGIYPQGGNLLIDRYTTLLGVNTSSATISSGTVTGILTVPKGVNSTDAAQFSQVPTITDWASYTPSFAGLGTVSSVGVFWKQIDKTIYVRGYCATGTVNGNAVTISLPNSTVLNTNHLPTSTASQLGMGNDINGGGARATLSSNVMFGVNSDTSHVYVSRGGQGGGFTQDAGTTLFTSGDGFSFEFSYPI